MVWDVPECGGLCAHALVRVDSTPDAQPPAAARTRSKIYAFPIGATAGRTTHMAGRVGPLAHTSQKVHERLVWVKKPTPLEPKAGLEGGRERQSKIGNNIIRSMGKTNSRTGHGPHSRLGKAGTT